MTNTTKQVIKLLNNSGISVPKGYEENLLRNAEKYGGIPKMKCIEAIIKACKPWKPYVADDEEYSKLVCKKIVGMMKIHTAVISSHPENRAYIGNICSIKQPLPKCMTTLATFDDAKAYIRPEFGKEMRELF